MSNLATSIYKLLSEELQYTVREKSGGKILKRSANPVREYARAENVGKVYFQDTETKDTFEIKKGKLVGYKPEGVDESFDPNLTEGTASPSELIQLRAALIAIKGDARRIKAIKWGHDGDGGADNLADDIIDSADSALKIVTR